MVSDGLSLVGAVAGATHQPQPTGAVELAGRTPRLWAINTVLSNLKTAVSGTHHAFDFEGHAHRYLADVQYCANRRFDLATTLGRLLRASANASPVPTNVIREAEVHS